jgi:hypothetical protein
MDAGHLQRITEFVEYALIAPIFPSPGRVDLPAPDETTATA